MAISRLCSIPDCGKTAVNSKGWCTAHYTRWIRHGDPTAGRTTPGAPLQFLEDMALKYEGNECLIWPYGTNKGYGTIKLNGRKRFVSRIVCEAANGPPPTRAHEAAHSCGNGHNGCCSQRHLSWKTPLENAQDRIQHGTSLKGEENPTSKLTSTQVEAIFELCKTTSPYKVSLLLGIPQSTIRNIAGGNSWRWLTQADSGR